MGTTCRGICAFYKTSGIRNAEKYLLGHKRCTYCSLFLDVEEYRCPCCKTKLRTKARGRRQRKDIH